MVELIATFDELKFHLVTNQDKIITLHRTSIKDLFKDNYVTVTVVFQGKTIIRDVTHDGADNTYKVISINDIVPTSLDNLHDMIDEVML